MPTMEEVLRAAIGDRLSGVRTAFVAEVRAWDADTQTADVRPVVRRRVPIPGADAATVREAVIQRVPVVYPGGAGFTLTYPLSAGDYVLCVCAERSHDEWRATRAPDVTAQDARRHDIADAFAVPLNISSNTRRPAADASDLVLTHRTGGLELRITPDGRVHLGTGAADVLGLLDALLEALQTAVTATALGPQPLDPATQTQLAVIRAALSTIRA